MPISLKLLSNRIKKPFCSRENILAIYSPKKYTIYEADTTTIDTEININLPPESKVYVATKFQGQKIKKIRGPKKKRLRITLLNESYFTKFTVNRGEVIGYLLTPDSDFCIHEKKKRHKIPKNYQPKRWDWKNFWKKKEGGVVRQEAFLVAMTLPMLAEIR